MRYPAIPAKRGHSTRLSSTFYRHLKQVNEALKHIWTAEPTDKQAQQRDYVLKHLPAGAESPLPLR
jgi:hypothetical protein